MYFYEKRESTLHPQLTTLNHQQPPTHTPLCSTQWWKCVSLCVDKEWWECCQHSWGVGEPHTGADPRWGCQLVSASDGTAAGHTGCPASGPAARQQGVSRTQLQQGRRHTCANTHHTPHTHTDRCTHTHKVVQTHTLTHRHIHTHSQTNWTGCLKMHANRPIVYNIPLDLQFAIVLVLQYPIEVYCNSIVLPPLSSRRESGPVGLTSR